jgi:clan AA aspartic protease (TIGR02281 family)
VKIGKSIGLALLLAVFYRAHAGSVPLIHQDGSYLVPVVINDKISLNFVLDTGATEVSIPEDVYSTLKRAGAVAKGDLLSSAEYELADGTTRAAQRFRIRSLRIGELELRDVVASISPSGASLLLGQSFLERLPSWSIDNKRHLLVLGEPVASDEDTNTSTMKSANAASKTESSSAASVSEAPKTEFQEIQSRWPVKGESWFVDISDIKHDFGDVRRTWVWIMLGPDAERPAGFGQLLSFRWLKAFDCRSGQVRLESGVNRFATGEVPVLPTKDQMTWHKVTGWGRDEDYDSNELKAVCGR